MLMVSGDLELVEQQLVGGGLACPGCEDRLAGWGHARVRNLRTTAGEVRVRPRRARCVGCRSTHVLLPDMLLLRRRDSVEVIGAALVAHAGGDGYRRIAGRLGVPASTVRGWMRRFRVRAAAVAEFFTQWALVLDPGSDPPAATGSAVGDAVEAVGLATRAVVLRFGPAPAWPTAGRLSGGGLLCNTSCLWLRPV